MKQSYLSHDALRGRGVAKWLPGKIIFQVPLVDMLNIVIIYTPWHTTTVHYHNRVYVK